MSTSESAARWNREHPERHAASERRYRQRHPEVGREYKQKMRIRALDALGNRCCQCGFTDVRALEIDHINNGGCEDRRKRSRYSMYKGIVDGTARDNFQALCANCHQIKSYEEVWKPFGAEWSARRKGRLN